MTGTTIKKTPLDTLLLDSYISTSLSITSAIQKVMPEMTSPIQPTIAKNSPISTTLLLNSYVGLVEA